MKHVLLVFFLFAFSANILAQTPRVDTVYQDQWNTNAWESKTRSIFNYDADCRLATILSQRWNDTTLTWVNVTLTTNTYVSGNYTSESLTQVWNGSGWDNAFRISYTYDGSFKILTLLFENWVSNAWQIFTRTTYTYDINGYTDSVLTETGIFGPLQNFSLDIYTNNSDGTPSQVVHQIWFVVAWQNSTRDTYTYNADKTISQTVTENWNLIAWENFSRTTFTYASGKALTTLTERWQAGAWVNNSLTTNTYDGSGYLINTLDQTWNGSSWDNETQTNYTNNGDGTVSQSITQNWDAGSSAWANDTRTTYSYTTDCILPLKLLVFTASRNNNTVTLSWQTTEEINTSHFTVQRSTDGINFSSLGNVTARNNPQTNYYGFTDNVEKVTGDKVYYRLQMIDKDGKFTYSKIIPLTLELYAGKIKTYPNPVKDQLYILFNIQNAAKAELRIADATGKILYNQHLSTAQNNNAVGVNVASLAKGVYYVQIITDKGVQRAQFIKQ